MIFIASLEVEPLPGSKMEGHGIGAMVYCLIPAESRKDAEKLLHEALREDKYCIVKTEFFEEYENFVWKDSKDQIEYDRLAKSAALNNKLVYGEFYTWSHQE